MEKYIGTKIVQARPAFRATFTKNNCKVPRQVMTEMAIEESEADGWEVSDREEGYEVRYADGYRSWSPKDVFEAAYRPTDGMNFGLAIEAAKQGKKICRSGWNGDGMYVFLTDEIGFTTKADLSEFDDVNVEVGDVLVLRTAQGTLQPGWLASQSDMLADDWYIVE